MLVAMVTVPGTPAWAMIVASCSWYLALSTWCSILACLKRFDISSDNGLCLVSGVERAAEVAAALRHSSHVRHVESPSDLLPPDPGTCPDSGRSAVVDRFNQRAWLCESGTITETLPMTSAISQPDPGVYEVYAKDRNASSTISGEYSEMEYFVAFTYGKYQGARIAFHSVPTYPDGSFVQPIDSVGTAELHGDSAGCIRVLPEHAALIWRWLDIGDTVRVVT